MTQRKYRGRHKQDANNLRQKLNNIPGYNCRLTTWRVVMQGRQHYEVKKGNDVVGQGSTLTQAIEKARQAGFAK